MDSSVFKHGSYKFAADSSSEPFQYSISEQVLGEMKTEPIMPKVAGMDDQEGLDDPTALADPDSCFCEFEGVLIHHKLCDSESLTLDDDEDLPEDVDNAISDYRVGLCLPIILMHGFGASLFSWNRVMKPLARLMGNSKVLAFDRPAFGLTSRVDPRNQNHKPLNPYSTLFSVLSSMFFMDSLAADKAILVGHSAGSLVAVDTYFEAPERVAALILVAPAIYTLLMPQHSAKDDQRDRNKRDPYSHFTNYQNPIIAIFSLLSKLTKCIAQGIMYLKAMGGILNLLCKNTLCTFLRSATGLILVRLMIDKFGIAIVRRAWYDSNQVTDHVLQGYVKPLRVKGWDKALVEYIVAMLADSTSLLNPPQPKRLSSISCPVRLRR
ncbi:OLC1v1026986C3 [Oldenlandia corymbosa var. corymbosa]|uniref:OLC1v1026986C3 n=1 Tax=Oldenlandia corymbosa var. corymbosa TaxID=529605 RepID=A0AAV1C957_OLDCO|nr:OLC1v1026986C3 [Oldenlandia corymbosa var. corymbosa]